MPSQPAPCRTATGTNGSFGNSLERLLGAADARAAGISGWTDTIAALRDTLGISGVNPIYRGNTADIVEVLRRSA